MFVVSVYGEQYREELILNVIVFVVSVYGEQYTEELLMNITVLCDYLGSSIVRGTDTECYCVCCEGLGGAIENELILNVNLFVLRVWAIQYREELILNVTVFVVKVWGGQ